MAHWGGRSSACKVASLVGCCCSEFTLFGLLCIHTGTLVLEYAGFVCLSPPRPCTQSGPLSSPPLALLTAHTLVCVGLWLTGGLMRSHVGVCLSVERCCRPRWPPPKDCPNTCAYRYVVRNDQAPNHQSLLGRFLSAFLVWAHK